MTTLSRSTQPRLHPFALPRIRALLPMALMLVLLATLVDMLATDNRPTTVAALPELDAAGASAMLP